MKEIGEYHILPANYIFTPVDSTPLVLIYLHVRRDGWYYPRAPSIPASFHCYPRVSDHISESVLISVVLQISLIQSTRA